MPEEPLIADRYQALELIGSGGEARVFRALDRQLNREVALRLPRHPGPPQKSPAPAEWHPGWVRLLEQAPDGSYQIFELLEGETLRQKIGQAPLDEKCWLEFIRQSLDAVEALHAAGWIHGDLNAENFLHVKTSWKLLELPFLRLAVPAHRSTLFGSIHTLAPEQMKNQAADARSDLYALGCLYYYAAAGEYPHAGSSSQEIAISLLRFSPVPLREKVPAISPQRSEWVMTLLQRDPQSRFPSIAAARRLL
jgi:serine/threonine protein kinase